MSKTALITGASAGIGASIAAKLASTGVEVFITGRNQQRLKQVAESINAKGYWIGDLTDDNAPNDLYNAAISALGGVDILVNNAGEYVWANVEKANKEQIQRVFKLNLEVPYELCSLVSKGMKQNKYGRIVSIGSISGVVGEANASLYSASKSGLIGMTKALALELAEFGITINVVNPGWVKTELANEHFSSCEQNEEECIDMIPQRRFIHPDEVANMVCYLVSDDAKGVTGQSMSICAGLSVG